MIAIIDTVKNLQGGVMRVSQEEKERTRSRIVREASRLFRRRGVEGASVGDVMKAAGLTHGGFYRHFKSKNALLESALDEAFGEMISRMESSSPERSSSAVRQAFRTFYLSEEHRLAPVAGCPAAALSGDIARTEEPVKRAFSRGLKRMIDGLSETFSGPEKRRRQQAIRELSVMVGAMMLARASDPETAKQILAAIQPDGA